MSGGVVILNPVSGTGDHAETVHELATRRGYDVRETASEGGGVTLAREAVDDGATFIAAAGGDGTVNEVVRGVEMAGALDRVTVGVVPCGTGNDFAGNIGVTGIEHAFEVFGGGDRREIDLGLADGRPFLNSCVVGLTAKASAGTDPEMKSQYGTVAYVIETLRSLRSFDGIRVRVEMYDAESDSDPVWNGSAVAVLVGNGRQFPPGGSMQGNIEDGKFNVTLVTETGSLDLVMKAAAETLLERDTPQTNRYTVPALTISAEEAEPIAFSLDGEIVEQRQLTLRVRPGAVRMPVGAAYQPVPES